MICSECGMPILIGMKYMKHESGKILCEVCFKEMVESGEVE